MLRTWAAVAEGVAYARSVAAGEIPASRYVIAACERFLQDLADAEAGNSPWEFRVALAEKPMLFAGLLPNIKGPEAG